MNSMDSKLEKYLNTIEKRLVKMPASERIDIVGEIKSHIVELSSVEKLSAEEIMERLGPPDELAVSYLGAAISKDNTFGWRKLLMVISFNFFAGFSGLFVIPLCVLLSVTLLFLGAVAPLAGIIKAIGFLLGYDMAFISFEFGSYVAHPLVALPISIVMSIVFLGIGILIWRLMLKYIRVISKGKDKINYR